MIIIVYRPIMSIFLFFLSLHLQYRKCDYLFLINLQNNMRSCLCMILLNAIRQHLFLYMLCVLNVACVVSCMWVFYYCSAMLNIYPVIAYPYQVTNLVLINMERVSVVSITLSDSSNRHVILPNTYLIVLISHIASMKVYFVLSLSCSHVLYLYINYI
jgi:hypothetical protein